MPSVLTLTVSLLGEGGRGGAIREGELLKVLTYTRGAYYRGGLLERGVYWIGELIREGAY